MKLSLCIPTYEMRGEAKRVLTRSFDMLKKQTFKDFEVIISDNSENNIVKDVCEDPEYQSLRIKYFKNPRKGAAANTNEAMKKASGKLIKILHMDDYLADENSLRYIADNFKGDWLVSGCAHDNGDGNLINEHYPTYNRYIYLGKNTIGAPSVLTIKNENIVLFDESLQWLFDCDYYKKMCGKYGEPEILNKINVIIGIGKHQRTNLLSKFVKIKEHFYMANQYKKELLYWLKLW